MRIFTLVLTLLLTSRSEHFFTNGLQDSQFYPTSDLDFYRLKNDKFNDYSYDENYSCERVSVNLMGDNDINKVLTGLVHSPSYKIKSNSTKTNPPGNPEIYLTTRNRCEWNLNAPDDYHFELTMIDYQNPREVKCSDGNRLSMNTMGDATGDASFWMNVNSTKGTKVKMENNQVDNCEHAADQQLSLKWPFVKIETNSNNLVIVYEADGPLATSDFQFLLSFKAIHNLKNNPQQQQQQLQCDKNLKEIKCTRSLSNGEFKHYSCVNQNLICNCVSLTSLLESDDSSSSAENDLKRRSSEAKTMLEKLNKINSINNCDYFIDTFEDYLSMFRHPAETKCDYYLSLNSKCRSNKTAFNLNRNVLNNMDSISQVEVQDNELAAQTSKMNRLNEATSSSASPDWFNNYDGNNILAGEPSSDPSARTGGDVNEKNPASYEIYPSYGGDLCSGVIRTNEYGWIASPNFYADKSTPYKYELNCSYHIIMQPYQTVQIRFKYFFLNANTIEYRPAFKKTRQQHDSPSKLNMQQAGSDNNSTREKSKDDEKDTYDVENFNLNERLPLFDYDYVSIHDGPDTSSPLLFRFTASQNDFNRNFKGKTFNSRTNVVFVVFHSQMRPLVGQINTARQYVGFNFTYQIRGYCVEDQVKCRSVYTLDCYAKEQRCNDVWDCQNGADERGCFQCKEDSFKCRSHSYCYKEEDRCDGDPVCIDKSDELNCDKWVCNSENGTFLCGNGRCIYEQWVCDGTNDCDDGTDEINCPTTLSSRRVITTAVLGGTLCCLLLVMALGCACKLYTLHTVGYRNSLRLSQSVQSAAAMAAAAATLNSNTNGGYRSSSSRSRSRGTGSPANTLRSSPNGGSALNQPLSDITSFFRRQFNHANNRRQAGADTATVGLLSSTTTGACSTAQNLQRSPPNATEPTDESVARQGAAATAVTLPPGELPLPHHLIAPPTYNQTMGLVDEYEQRQLAFIEHVRTILSQQQQQQQQQQQNQQNSTNIGLINLNSATSLSLIPTVNSTSTTVHRVTNAGSGAGGSSLSGRRSHSTRHHRHHHHASNRSTSNNEHYAAASSSPLTTSDSANVLTTSNINNSSSTHRIRSSHHRHHHHRHHYSQSQNRHHVYANSIQQNFDANRRGLQFETASSSNQEQENERETNSRRVPTTLNDNSNQQAVNNTGPKLLGSTSPTTGGAATSALVASTSTPVNNSNSLQLRDRIAKLLKDIVVHHDDNIQYVQLSDQISSSSDSCSLTNQTADSSNQANTTLIDHNSRRFTSPNQPPTGTNESNLMSRTSETNSNSNMDGSEDDLPLIR